VLGWFRAKRSACAMLALLALAVQLYLSFGHMHAEELGLSTSASVTRTAQPADAPAAPHDDNDRDVCSICAAVSLTAHSLLTTPVALALPMATEWAWLQPPQASFLFSQTPSNVRARSPPTA